MYVQVDKEKKMVNKAVRQRKKATNVDETHVQVHMGIFIHFGAGVFFSQFSPHFGEKTFWWT